MKLFQPLALLLLLAAVSSAPLQDLVTSLKGYYDFSQQFQIYSGYLQLQASPLISNHYVFITSKNDPANDDLVLWLNGGPGCTSMYGFLQQFGPQVIIQGADGLPPYPNPFSWNRKANFIFIESPPGVGFSINEDPTYLYNDVRSAQDNLQSLRVWFQKFPQFQNHRFWISGQSYAGIYIPQLADLILKNQDSLIPGKRVDFRGLFIGNAALQVDNSWRTQVTYRYFASHYFFGPQILDLIQTCKYNSEDNNNTNCQIGLALADNALSRINYYYTTGICYNLQPLPFSQSTPRKRYEYVNFAKRLFAAGNGQPGCDTDDSGLINYLNDPEVQVQLHVRPTQWVPCNGDIYSTYVSGPPTVPLFETFKSAGLKMMLFSGNVDSVVPYMQTEVYLSQIGWNIAKPKTPIKNPKGSLEAWVTIYENNLAYYVVNGAGHMVPNQKPDATLKMFQSFISGTIWTQ